MLASYRWIRDISRISATPDELASALTFSGLEIEGVTHVGDLSEEIVLAKVVSKTSHPSRDKLSIVEVDDGVSRCQVVCGAPNCPDADGLVVLARPGARFGNLEIAARSLAGVMSQGMLASEQELGIGPDGDGILILNGETDAALGTPLKRALDLEDWILDLSITPNRPDALSHRGLAREAALLFGTPYEPANPSFPAPHGAPIEALAEVTLVAGDLCPRYGAAVVTEVAVGPSPFRVRYRLHHLGLRAISNLVDVTNLIMLEYGQPIHAFDLDKLQGKKIVIRRARDGETMRTLDGVDRVFTTDDLLICDRDRPVAVAGVMGGLDTGVTGETKRVLIECAYFNPSSIRKTAKSLKLSSDASYRFERGIDPNMGPHALAAAAGMMVALSAGKQAPGVIDCYPKPITPKVVALRPERYRALVGYYASPDEMRRILVGLGAAVAGTDEALEVRVPTSRPDIEREVDLIEEVVRIRGFGDVPAALPKTACLPPDRPSFEALRRAKELLASLGLEEAISYSFVPKDLLALLGESSGTVEIANPLSKERATMRTTLVAGLLESLKRAQSRFLTDVRQFEVARTFHDVGAELPSEVLRAAAMLSGSAPRWVGEAERRVDYFDAKGIVERFLFEYAGIKPDFRPSGDIPFLHPKRACRVYAGGSAVGVIGEVHPEVLSKLKMPRGAVLFELAIEALWRNRRLPEAAVVPELPSMVRDVALLVDETNDSGPIGEALRVACGELAVDVRIFDVYTGQGIPAGKKSLAFSITYRAEGRTLTDDEVDGVHKSAIEKVQSSFGAVQR